MFDRFVNTTLQKELLAGALQSSQSKNLKKFTSCKSLQEKSRGGILF